MFRRLFYCLTVFAMTSACAQQLSDNPFPNSVGSDQLVVSVDYLEFARIPNAGNGDAPRLMHMVAEPDTQRLFVSTMLGMLYSISYDGQSVTLYLDIDAERWDVGVLAAGNERGLQSFAFHPQFSQAGTPGYGRFYTYLDTPSGDRADFESGGRGHTHDTILLEWTANDASATAYDGGAPRELFRAAQPFPNHNGGQIGFNPNAAPDDEDFGLLYLGLADGGSGGDPMGLGQDLARAFGKILRIDPLGDNSANGKYGIPASNPWAGDDDGETLGEIYAIGVRNPQRFNWDPQTGRMILADIGQNQVEEISPITAGANLGWNLWEGSYRYINRQVSLENPRSGAGMTWPIVEYDHNDSLFRRQVAVTGVTVFRDDSIPRLQDRIVFGDNPNGELFYVDADKPADGGIAAIGRILLNDAGVNKTLLQLIQEASQAQGRGRTDDADLRFGHGPNGELFLLNKRDGIIRLVVPDGVRSPQLL